MEICQKGRRALVTLSALPVFLVVAPEEAPFVLPALEEVVHVEAMVAAAMVAVVPTEEPAAMVAAP